LTTIEKILSRTKTIAVVGASSDRTRAAFGVPRYLQRAGFRIIPVNPRETEVLGEKAYASLADVPDKIDLVAVFRRPQFVPEIVDQAIALGIPAVWLQSGIVHEEAKARAESAGVDFVMDRCLMVEHMGLAHQPSRSNSN
jgi:predicted CoA-binding protein